jgi:hypothetical protein
MEKRQRERLRRQKQMDKEQRRVQRTTERRLEREKGDKNTDLGESPPQPQSDEAV